MLASGIIRRFPVLAVVLLLLPATRALAQTDPAATPAPPPAAGASSSQSAVTLPPLAPDGFFKEPVYLGAGVDLLIDKLGNGQKEPKSGFYPEFSNMITGSGWVSVGPGYRQYWRNDHLMLDTSAAVSWHFYKMGQARIEGRELADGHLTVGTQAMWQDQTQVNFFGVGPDVLNSDKTQYRLQSLDFVGYGAYQTNDWLTFDGTVGWLPRPKLLPPGGSFRGDYPDTLVVFSDEPAASVSKQPDFLHGTVAATADTLDYRGHPTSGGRYRAAFTWYSDRSTGIFSFRQYEAEGTQIVPLRYDRRWLLAFRGWVVLTDVPSGNEVPFYLLPAIGGNNTLRSYHNLEFHDLNSLVANAESRWALFTHVDGALFLDAGNVAATAGDLNLGTVSYGAGVRVHIERTTIARLDVAHGVQGWQVVFRTSDPLRLKRGKRWIASIPFTP